MRVSVIKNDSGYNPICIGIEVSLDGVSMGNVITADDNEGYLDRYVTNAAGELIADVDEYRIERLHGVISITGLIGG